MTSDLLSYSIMMNGDKAITYTSPHYAPLTVAKLPNITLPPIANYVRLTETNLKLLTTSLRDTTVSLPPLLTSLSALDLPLLLPRPVYLDLKSSESAANAHISGAAANTLLAANIPISGTVATPESPQKKRRQRLGPSCDNCRVRKVKCNADVVMLSRHFDIEPDIEFTALLPEQQEAVSRGAAVTVADNYTLVVSNNKLIKFKACLSCAGKALRCCFSKGFTKEDIVHSKRMGPTEVVVVERRVAKVAKRRAVETAGTRKSLCSACRRRKIKCVMHSRLQKCVGCVKKDTPCLFEA